MNWKGRRIVITAGPTREYLDPVRFITNASTGMMGFELARAAKRRGAKVTLISGPTELKPPRGVRRVSVLTADQMLRKTLTESARADVVIAAAAVGDWKPTKYSGRKLKKNGKPLRLTFIPTEDILASLCSRRRRHRKTQPVLVGFALETHDWINNARKKLRSKGADFIVANKHTAMGAKSTRIALVSEGAPPRRFPVLTKFRAAEKILDKIEEVLIRASRTP